MLKVKIIIFSILIFFSQKIIMCYNYIRKERLLIMTQEQKKFKIKKIESYKQQISEEEKIAINKTWLIGISACAVLISCIGPEHNTELNQMILDYSIVLLGSGMAVYHLKGLIEAICKKTMLQGKIEDITTEVDRSVDNHYRGKKI